MSMKMTMAEFVGLEPCPFCGGEAHTLNQAPKGTGYSVGCSDDECRGFIALSWIYATEAKAIAAWNSRAETCEFNIKDNMNETEGMGDVWIECSACNCVFDFYADDWLMKMSYCPNCGARVVS